LKVKRIDASLFIFNTLFVASDTLATVKHWIEQVGSSNETTKKKRRDIEHKLL
jgi:hypothetical protein